MKLWSAVWLRYTRIMNSRPNEYHCQSSEVHSQSISPHSQSIQVRSQSVQRCSQLVQHNTQRKMKTKQDTHRRVMQIAGSPPLRRPFVIAATTALDGHGGVICQGAAGAPTLGHPYPAPALAVVVCTDGGDILFSSEKREVILAPERAVCENSCL